MIDLENLRRNSGISLDREGRFFHEGSLIENDRIQTLFRAGLEVRDDGEVILRVGDQWCYVTCEGVAFFVSSISVREGKGIELTLTNGAREWLYYPSLRIVGDNDLYCAVKEGQCSARFLRGAYHQLASYFDDGGDAGNVACVLEVSGERYPVQAIEQVPGITFQ